ncbi:MAG: 2OG-Fe(II) oxygenase [Burkholderiaceae bacterium]
MSNQPVTPELREWIVAQASAGQSPDVVLKAMLTSGWGEDVAIAALEAALRSHLNDHAKAANLPAPSIVPEPLAEGPQTSLRAHDRDVRVVMAMRNPRIVVFGGLFSDAECDELIQSARTRLIRSETVEMATGGNEVNEARTSDGMFFARGETPLIQQLEARIGALIGWPVENGEGLQILRYRPGAEYKPHYDYFDPAKSGTASILTRGGQRVASLVCYLNTPAKGGATVFPDVHLDVAPCKGNAVFFSYDRAHPMTRSLHGGAPVIEGEKWVATKWLREGRFD